MDIADFLRARLDEDEWTAQAAKDAAVKRTHYRADMLSACDRDLRDVDAKRRILAGHRGSGVTCPRCSLGIEDGEVVYELDPCTTVRLLALRYEEHRDYDPAWKPLT